MVVDFLVGNPELRDCFNSTDSFSFENASFIYLQNKEKTLLHIAAEKNNVSSISALLNFGLSLQSQDQDGKTPVDCARERVILLWLKL